MERPNPEAARERLEQWKARAEAQMERTREMSARLQDVTVTASDPHGVVEVTIDSGGRLIDLTLSPVIRRQVERHTASTILQTVREAQRLLAERTRGIVADTVGGDSEIARAVTAEVDERFGAEELSADKYGRGRK